MAASDVGIQGSSYGIPVLGSHAVHGLKFQQRLEEEVPLVSAPCINSFAYCLQLLTQQFTGH